MSGIKDSRHVYRNSDIATLTGLQYVKQGKREKKKTVYEFAC